MPPGLFVYLNDDLKQREYDQNYWFNRDVVVR